MDTVWANIISVLFVFALAIISPGPNFILVVNASLNRTRGEGLSTSAGVAVGSALFAVAGLLGFMLLIQSIPHFQGIMRYLGSGYLLFLGFKMILSFRTQQILPEMNQYSLQSGKGWAGSFLQGLVTNMTNPKAWAFYISLFALVGHPDFPLWAKLLICITIFLMALSWYGTITLVISNHHFRRAFTRIQGWMNLAFGLILTGFALEIFLKS